MIYYVTQDGSDYNPGGSEGLPLRTHKRATELMVPGDTCLTKQGVYSPFTVYKKGGLTYKAYPGHHPIIDAIGLVDPGYPIGAFYVEDSGNISAEGFEVRNALLYSGVYAYGQCENVRLKNFQIHDTKDSGILAVGSWNGSRKMKGLIIDGCETYNTNIGGGQESVSLVAVDNFEVKNNHVHDVKSDKEGIDCKVGCTNGAIFKNEVFNAKVGLYLDPNGTPISNISAFQNIFHNNFSAGMALGSEGPLRSSLTGVKVFDNLVFANPTGMYVFPYNFQKTFSLINNTFFGNGRAEVCLYDSPAYNIGCIIRNNILFSTAQAEAQLDYPEYLGAGDGVAVDHNLFFGGASKPSNVYGKDFILADPLFVNPGMLDFRLRKESPAIDAGSSEGAPSIDFDGFTRPRGKGFDIGAYEFASVNPSDLLQLPLPPWEGLPIPSWLGDYLPWHGYWPWYLKVWQTLMAMGK